MTHTSKKSPKSSQKTSPKSQNRSKKISHKSISCFNLASFIKKQGITYAVRLKKLPYGIEPLKELIKTVKGEDCRMINIMPQKTFVKVTAGTKHILLPERILDLFLNKLNWSKEQLAKDGVIYRVTYEANYKHHIQRKKKQKLIKAATEADGIPKHSLRKITKWDIETRNTLLENSTNAEKLFFKQLPLSVAKDVVQQYPIKANKHKYFIDMYYPPTKVAVEIDGGYHREEEQIAKDKERDKNLLSLGIRTLRLRNADVRSSGVMKYAVEFMLNRKI
jgi:very-short-patch-repair endonuclease